jgi:hypothetical protein
MATAAVPRGTPGVPRRREQLERRLRPDVDGGERRGSKRYGAGVTSAGRGSSAGQ